MSDWISWIKAQSSGIVDTVKNETAVLSGSIVESVYEIADQASKALANEEDEQDSGTLGSESGQTKHDKEGQVSLIEKLDLMAANTEDYIDSLANNMTAKIGTFLSKAITIIPDTPEINLASDRRSNLLFEMQKNPDTYATDYSFVADELQVQRFQYFCQEFSVKDRQKEIDLLLEEVGVVRDFFQRMVPDPLDYDTFWARYFFKVSEIDFQENARSMALKGDLTNSNLEALGNQGEVIWDDSDEELPKDVTDENIKKSDEEDAEKFNDSKDNQDSKDIIEKSADTETQKDGSKEAGLEPEKQDEISNKENELESSLEAHVSLEQDKEFVNGKGNISSAVPEEKLECEDVKEEEYIQAQVSGINLKSLQVSKDDRSSQNSDGSFDIIRKESVQPLEVSTKDNKNLTSDDDWGGWDDSPDSPTVG